MPKFTFALSTAVRHALEERRIQQGVTTGAVVREALARYPEDAPAPETPLCSTNRLGVMLDGNLHQRLYRRPRGERSAYVRAAIAAYLETTDGT
jgi:hypothetical protein